MQSCICGLGAMTVYDQGGVRVLSPASKKEFCAYVAGLATAGPTDKMDPDVREWAPEAEAFVFAGGPGDGAAALNWIQVKVDAEMVVIADITLQPSDICVDELCTKTRPVYDALIAVSAYNADAQHMMTTDVERYAVVAQPGDKVTGTDWSKIARYGGFGVAVLGLLWFVTRK